MWHRSVRSTAARPDRVTPSAPHHHRRRRRRRRRSGCGCGGGGGDDSYTYSHTRAVRHVVTPARRPAYPHRDDVCPPFDFPLSFVSVCVSVYAYARTCVRVLLRRPRVRVGACARRRGGAVRRRPNSASLSALSGPPERRYPHCARRTHMTPRPACSAQRALGRSVGRR